MCASKGDASEAETILKQMRDAGHPPGPKAYNALIYSYVKSKNANGALNAMRSEVSAGKSTCCTAETMNAHIFYPPQ